MSLEAVPQEVMPFEVGRYAEALPDTVVLDTRKAEDLTQPTAIGWYVWCPLRDGVSLADDERKEIEAFVFEYKSHRLRRHSFFPDFSSKLKPVTRFESDQAYTLGYCVLDIRPGFGVFLYGDDVWTGRQPTLSVSTVSYAFSIWRQVEHFVRACEEASEEPLRTSLLSDSLQMLHDRHVQQRCTDAMGITRHSGVTEDRCLLAVRLDTCWGPALAFDLSVDYKNKKTTMRSSSGYDLMAIFDALFSARHPLRNIMRPKAGGTSNDD